MAAGVRLTYESWLWHINHLQNGNGFQNDCDVCGLDCKEILMQDLVGSVTWYRKAQQSGKKFIQL